MTSTTTDVGIGPETRGVGREDREAQNGHRPAVLWMTGLSGSGKSTLSRHLERVLFERGCRVMVLDGDALRQGISRDLGFSLEDRTENIRRAGEIARLFVESGMVVLTAFISPLRMDREMARSLFKSDEFLEIYCDATLETCERRDVKGLYQKARLGLISEFTGISSPYEPPDSPEFHIRTGQWPVSDCVEMILDGLEVRGILPPLGNDRAQA